MHTSAHVERSEHTQMSYYHEGDTGIVDLIWRGDYSEREWIFRTIAECLSKPMTNLILNVDLVDDYSANAGFRALHLIVSTCRDHGVEPRIVINNQDMLDLLEVTGHDVICQFFLSLAEAKQDIAKDYALA